MSLDYTPLIASQHVDKPNFLATISLLTGSQGIGGIYDTLASLPAKFDVDAAEGEQLDFVGLWVGGRRSLTLPLDIYFAFDTAGRGFDEAAWFGPGAGGAGITLLDDATFRLLIKSLIAADHWDGTLRSYQMLMTAVLAATGNGLYAIDNQDMTMSVVVTGPKLSLIVQSIINNGILGIKPAGVAISSYAFPSGGGGPISGAAKAIDQASGKLS
jgi:hypothetical protein